MAWLHQEGVLQKVKHVPNLTLLSQLTLIVLLLCRLVLHLFLHSVQTSISFQIPPLVPFVELCFSPPAARDLWRAPSAEAWRACYVSKSPIPVSEGPGLPRVSEMMHSFTEIAQLGELLDLDLCHVVLLNSFWSVIAAYRETVKFYHQPDRNPSAAGSNTTRRLWMDSQQQEIYHDLCGISASLSASSYPGFRVTAELLKMTLHVSLDALQRFAGKSGEEEARRASIALENDWMQSPDARYAVWHAVSTRSERISHAFFLLFSSRPGEKYPKMENFY